ncbi:putative small GTPase superfamily, Rho family protein [Lyophyllum shimeji]|uniref:Small GTPase superfamily, Rho family protein n=1 Tax=Lyophyllum shimeji TaxID=47721 RepID=A0A9P3PPY1_LYOSH|nr:putative small GTPase superfamily, Rho family protein [Lyophyllum shimeji]
MPPWPSALPVLTIQMHLYRHLYFSSSVPVPPVPVLEDGPLVDAEVDGQQVTLNLWDTTTYGSGGNERLRPLYYPNADVIVLCFAIDSPESLDRVEEKWFPEAAHFAARVPIVLVGCKSDLRGTSTQSVSRETGMAVAQKIDAVKYLECSAKSGEGHSRKRKK